MFRTILAITSLGLAAACTPSPIAPVEQVASLSRSAQAGLVRRLMPSEDPGPPFYARVGAQTLESSGYVVIPFYRSPDAVPDDFNLLSFFHFPGAGGPGAFVTPLLMDGFLLIEADAPLGTFPKQAVLRGTDTPIWFVPAAAFHAAASDGVLTMPELRALAPLYGTAHRFHETLHPRDGEHKIIIQADGSLPDGRTFSFSLADIQDEPRSIRLTIR